MKKHHSFPALSAALVALAAASLAACVHVPTEHEQTPEGVKDLALSHWLVTTMGSVATVPGKAPEIRFTKDGRVEGTTGCNRFFGSYVQDGAKVTFSGTGATKMACLEDGVMQQEAAFLAILQGEVTVSFERPFPGALSHLTVTGANGTSFKGVPILPGVKPR